MKRINDIFKKYFSVSLCFEIIGLLLIFISFFLNFSTTKADAWILHYNNSHKLYEYKYFILILISFIVYAISILFYLIKNKEVFVKLKIVSIVSYILNLVYIYLVVKTDLFIERGKYINSSLASGFYLLLFGTLITIIGLAISRRKKKNVW